MSKFLPGNIVFDKQAAPESIVRRFMVIFASNEVYYAMCEKSDGGLTMISYPRALLDDHPERFCYDGHSLAISQIRTDLRKQKGEPVLKPSPRLQALVACEESQRITLAQRKLGVIAYSCDVMPCSGGYPQFHIQDSCLHYINGNCTFTTQDGKTHTVSGKWDLLIAHPPCTYLTNASSMRLRVDGVIDEERMQKAREAKEFFMQIYHADCDHICIENPVPGRIHELPRYTYQDEPYNHGDPWKKRTAFWLKGLSPVTPTNVVEPQGLWVGASSKRREGRVASGYTLTSHRDSRKRSLTFQGMANAMAKQFVEQIECERKLYSEGVLL